MITPVVFTRRRPHACGARPGALILGLLLAAGSLTACRHAPAPGVRLLSRQYASSAASDNHAGVAAIPSSIRRVAVLPLHTEAWRSTEIDMLEASLLEALGLTGQFEAVAVTRAEMTACFGRESFASAGSLPADLLTRLHAETGADAVLLLDLTHFAPYQPLALGIRARLVTVDAGESLWAFDSIFDASHPDVSLAARQFGTGERRPPSAVEDYSGVLQSPARFAKYVGAAMFETLPPRRTR